MTAYAGDMALSNLNSYNNKAPRKVIWLSAQMTVGASGAVGATVVDDNAITFTKNGGTGDYTITYPKCFACIPFFQVVSAADTVNTFNLKALDASAGTLNVIAQDASTAANPASGNVVSVLLFLVAE